jgi:hypothetical protein
MTLNILENCQTAAVVLQKGYDALSEVSFIKSASAFLGKLLQVSADQCAHTERNLALLASTPYTSAIFTRNKKAPMPGAKDARTPKARHPSCPPCPER